MRNLIKKEGPEKALEIEVLEPRNRKDLNEGRGGRS